MKSTSVRMRLLIWNIAVLALVLFGFLLIAHLLIRTYMLNAMDQRLAEMANRQQHFYTAIQHNPPPEPPPPLPDPAESRSMNERFQRMMRIYDLQGKQIRGNREINNKEQVEYPPWDKSAYNQARKGDKVFSLVKYGDEVLRVYSLPLLDEQKQTGVIQTSLSYAEAQSLLESLTLLMIILVPVALLIAGWSGLLLTNRALRPVRHIIEKTRALNPDDLAQRLPVNGADEFGQLANTMNEMLARIETAFNAMRSLMERERRFTADASHELRTPLTAIRANTSLVLRGDNSVAETRESVQAIDQAGKMMQHVIEDLLLLASSDSGQFALQPQAVPVRELFFQAAAMARHQQEQAEMSINVTGEMVEIWGDPNQLSRLLVNLINNALRHTPSTGKISLSAARQSAIITVTVADTGEGISAEHLPHLGERFYRVDAARARQQGGAGLGLAICRSIVEAHGGEMSISSIVGEGTTVTLLLPAPDGDSE